MFSRRAFLASGAVSAASIAAGCAVPPPPAPPPAAPVTRAQPVPEPPPPPPMPEIYGAIPDERYPIPAVPDGIVPPQYWRQRVPDPTGAAPGTLVVDPRAFYLYLVEPDGTAMRYGIGVGRQGFGWSGNAVMEYKRRWPTWTPPAEMIARQPELEKYSAANGGQPPGLDNPLGARALYLYQDGRDTLYRIHGTNEPRSIGRAVSSGCIRLLNQDAVDIYNRVQNGVQVIVRPARRPKPEPATASL